MDRRMQVTHMCQKFLVACLPNLVIRDANLVAIHSQFQLHNADGSGLDLVCEKQVLVSPDFPRILPCILGGSLPESPGLYVRIYGFNWVSC